MDCNNCQIPFSATKSRDNGETFIGYCSACKAGQISISNKVADYHVAYALANRDLMAFSRVVTCTKCGSPDVVAVNFDHNISLCAACMPGMQSCDADLRDIPEPKAIGCKKCEYTGFAYGKIPCECNDGN